MSTPTIHVLLIENDARDVVDILRSFDALASPTAIHRVTGLDAAIEYLQGPENRRKRYPLPELILVNLSLSRKAEFKMLKWLRGQPTLRRIPVVVLAASRQPIGYQQASDLGAVSYLVKPVDPEALESIVKAVVTYWMLN